MPEPPAAELSHVERLFSEGAPPLIPLRSDYGDGHVIPPHRHRRHQLLYGSSGVVIAASPQGRWVMPPERGMWIPAGTVHDVRMLGAVRMQSLYFAPDVIAGMPERCEVLAIAPFMRALLREAMALGSAYDLTGRDGALVTLIIHEMGRLPRLPLSLPLPADEALAGRCRGFLRQPDAHATIDDWSTALGLSRRSFTRLFRRETGMSFVGWRQQACLVAALPRLAAGETVTAIAMELGYDNPAAFTAMFRRALGSPPRHYLAD